MTEVQAVTNGVAVAPHTPWCGGVGWSEIATNQLTWRDVMVIRTSAKNPPDSEVACYEHIISLLILFLGQVRQF